MSGDGSRLRRERACVRVLERTRVAHRISHGGIRHRPRHRAAHFGAERRLPREPHRDVDVAVVGLRDRLRERQVHQDAVAHSLGVARANARDDGNARVQRRRRRVAAAAGHRVERDVDRSVARAVERVVAMSIRNPDEPIGGKTKTGHPPLDRDPVVIAQR